MVFRPVVIVPSCGRPGRPTRWKRPSLPAPGADNPAHG
ncbi:hypothetical protein CU044_6945 [Streptomyces sp. L-9-10]|nr:hypothetical protein CU044_6945 [Streptomyces sp. L-9-10]